MSAASNVTVATPPPGVFSVQTIGGTAREAIDGARAKLVLAPLLHQDGSTTGGRPIERIVLGGKSFGTDAATVLRDALKSIPTLRHADFADCIASRETSEALDTLQIICDGVKESGAKLESLDLSDNALGVRGIPRISGAFHQQTELRHLYFNNDGLQAEAVSGLTQLIMDNFGGMSGTSLIETFEIASNCLEDAGFLALIPLLSKSPHLERLRIATTRSRNSKGEGVALAKTLLHLRKLKSLALNDNNFGVESGKILAQVISQNPELKSLNLGDIGVEEDGVREVLKAIRKLRPNTLELLDLAANEITGSSKFMKPLCDAIVAQSQSLQSLKLEDNELKSKGGKKILKALAGCTNLTYLNLNNTYLGASVADDLINFLKSHPSLKEIHLNGNHFTESQLEDIKSAVGTPDALQTMSDNDEEDEDEDEESEEEEADEPEAKHDAEVDALASGVAAAAVSK